MKAKRNIIVEHRYMLPFKYCVPNGEPETLNLISRKQDLTPDDLRHWNPMLAHLNCEDVIPSGTVVQLPPTLHVRGHTFGPTFLLRDYAEQLHSILESRAVHRDTIGSHHTNRFIIPRRKIASKREHAAKIVQMEAAQHTIRKCRESEIPMNSPCSAKKSSFQKIPYSKGGPSHFPDIFDGIDRSSTAEKINEMEASFHNCGLGCLNPDHVKLVTGQSVSRRGNFLSASTVQTVPDPSPELIKLNMDVQASFAFLSQRSVHHLHEIWAVLSSQNIGVLVDAFRCRTSILHVETKNSFLFIGGTFFIDDRHENFADLTEEIRGWDPVLAIEGTGYRVALPEALQGQKRGYGACEVKKISQTTFGDLKLAYNEMCLFRHCANCDHLFFLEDVRNVPNNTKQPLTHLSQYPRRTFIGQEKIVYCDVCEKLPASIATYGDLITPHNPTLFCKPCFMVAHLNEKGEEVNDGYVKYELPEGVYF